MKKDKGQAKFFSERHRGKANPVQVSINVTPGPASPARKQAWRKFWAKLITEVKRAAMEDKPSSESTE